MLKGKVSKIFMLILSLIMIISLNTGCVNKQNDNKATTGNKEVVNKNEPMEVTFFHNSIEDVKYDSYVVKDLEKRFNVKVKYLPWPDDAKEWINLQIASGDIPDIIRGIDFSVFTKYVKQNIIMEIPEELIREKAPKLVKWFENSAGKDSWNYYKVNGKNYSVPNVWELGSNWLTLGARLDWLKEVGYEQDHLTLDEFEDAMRKIKKTKGSKVYPLTGDIDSLNFVFGAFNTYPSTFTVDKNGKVLLGEILPGSKKGLEILHRWYEDGLLDPEFVVNKPEVVEEKFVGEKAGFTQWAYWSFLPSDAFLGEKSFKDKLNEINKNANVGVINFPKGPEGNFGTIEGNPVFDAGVMFSKNLANQPEKVNKYLEIFDASFDPEIVGLRFKGTEDVTYKITDQGYEWISPYDEEEKRIEYGIGTPFPVCFNDYTIQCSFTQLPKYKDLREESALKGVGKFDILEPIQRPIYAQKWTQLRELQQTNFVKFITGERNLDEFDDFIQEYKSAGGEAVLKEAQEVYDKLM